MRLVVFFSLIALLFQPSAFAAKKKAEKAYKLGVKAGNDGDISSAIDRFAVAVRIDKSYGQAWRDLGKALLAKDRYPEAVAALKRATVLNKKSYSSNSSLARAYMALGLPKLAVKPSKVALKNAKSGDKDKARIALASALSGAGDYAEAIKLFEKLTQKDPTNTSLLWKLAKTQHLAKKNDDAVSTLKKVASLEPGEKRAHLLMAQVHESTGNTDKAAEAYGAACDLGHQKSCLKSR